MGRKGRRGDRLALGETRHRGDGAGDPRQAALDQDARAMVRARRPAVQRNRQAAAPRAQGRTGGSGLRRIESADMTGPRSEEHTSELQSLMRISYAVFCLKKK